MGELNLLASPPHPVQTSTGFAYIGFGLSILLPLRLMHTTTRRWNSCHIMSMVGFIDSPCISLVFP
jgi:hypothetical protein